MAPSTVTPTSKHLADGTAHRPWRGACHRDVRHFLPKKLENVALTFSQPVDLEEMVNGVVYPVTKETMTKYAKTIKVPELRGVWFAAMCKELGRIAQGWGNTKGTDTIRFMNCNKISTIPSDRMVMYARIVYDCCPQNKDPSRVRLAVGGNLIDCPFECTTRTVDVTTSKIIWNSVISTRGAR